MTTGRINQVFTKVTVKRRRHGIHAHKPPATRYNFSDHRRRDEGCQTTAGPGEHPQTAHNQATGDSKDHPCPQKQARTKFTQEGKNPSKYLETAPENQNSRAQAAHANEQGASAYLEAAPPPHYTKKATRTTAGPHESGATGKPTTPTHKYYENAGSP